MCYLHIFYCYSCSFGHIGVSDVEKILCQGICDFMSHSINTVHCDVLWVHLLHNFLLDIEHLFSLFQRGSP